MAKVENSIYVCNSCGTCFSHKSTAPFIYGKCPLGNDTTSTRQNPSSIKERDFGKGYSGYLRKK